MNTWLTPYARGRRCWQNGSCLFLGMLMFGVAAEDLNGADEKPKSPLIMVVGCAEPTSSNTVWRLTRAGASSETTNPGVTAAEKTDVTAQVLGTATYSLVGVADFVTPQQSAAIDTRAKVIASERINTTSELREKHKVVVKGLLIGTTAPPTINLTSVAVLASQCS